MSAVLCPKCATPLPAGDGALCPRCLMSGFLFHESDGAPLGGVRFGEYELRERVASGGMGVVYKAWHTEMHRLVALKMLKSGRLADTEQRRRFAIEAEAVAHLDHPGIVPIYEVGENDGQPFYTMRLVGGGRSGTELSRAQPADFRRVAETVSAVARAVHFAHQRGILHRDLKPANILLDEAGNPLIVDFGLAKFTDADEGLTVSGAVLGTPAYMAPEVAAGGARSATVVSDVYSLGSLLYEWTTGRPPFAAATTMEILRRIAQEEALPPSTLSAGLPRDLDTICLKCLQKPPEKRYTSAAALADDLDRWLRGEPITARPVAAWERAARWCRRRPAAAALIAVCVLAVTAFIFQSQAANRRLAREKDAAQTQTILARDAERAALASSREARQSAYFSKIGAASQARLAGNYTLSRRLLQQMEPTGPDAEDLRGLEWHLVKNACEEGPPVLAIQASGPVISLAETPDRQHILAADSTGVHAWRLSDGSSDDSIVPGGKDHSTANTLAAAAARLKNALSSDSLPVPRSWEDPKKNALQEMLLLEWPAWGVSLSPVWNAIAALKPPETWSEWTFHDFAKATRPDTDLLRTCTQLLASPSARWVAFATAKHGTSIWSWPGRKLLAVLPGENASLAVSGDSRRLLVRTMVEKADRLEAVGILYDTSTWLPLRIFPQCGSPIALNHDGSRFAATPSGDTARVFDTTTGREVCKLFPNGGQHAMAFNERGNQIASADWKGHVMVHDVETGVRVARLEDVGDTLRAVAWLGNYFLAAGGANHAVKVWREDWEPMGSSFRHDQPVSSLAWIRWPVRGPAGGHLLSGGRDGKIFYQVIPNPERQARMEVSPPLLVFPGSPLFVGVRPSGKLALCDPVAHKILTEYDPPPEAYRMGLHRNGTSALYLQRLKATGEVRFIQIHAMTGALEHSVELKVSVPNLNNYAVSSDAARLAVIETPRLISLWDGATGERLSALSADSDVRCLRLSPDASVLYLFSDATWTARALPGGAELWREKMPWAAFADSSIAADMTLFAASMRDGTIDLYSFRDGKKCAHFTGHTIPAAPCAFTPDGTRLISNSGGGDIRMWDIQGSREVASLGWLSGATVFVTGDGKHLLMCGYGGPTVASP